MGRYSNERAFEQSILAGLPGGLRREVEVSASNIVRKIEPATVTRLERLAALAAEEGSRASTRREAETAYGLAAELRRRARLMKS